MSQCQRHRLNLGSLDSKVLASPILLARLWLPVWAQGHLTPRKARGLSWTGPAELLLTLSLPDWLPSSSPPSQGAMRAAISKLRKPRPNVRGAQCWKSIPARGLSLEPQLLPQGMLSVGPEGRGRRRGGTGGTKALGSEQLLLFSHQPLPWAQLGEVPG